MIKVMSENRFPANRQVEVQLGQRPVEAPSTSEDGLPGGAYSQGDPWPHSNGVFEASRSDEDCHISVGENERFASSPKILESLERALVAIQVVPDSSVPQGSNRTSRF